jgi:acyl carrier protein
MEQLIDTLRKQIVTALKLSDVKPEGIDPDAPLIGTGLGLDSIDSLELLVLLEKEYGVTVPDVNVGRQAFASVRSLASYIEQRRIKG